MKATPMRSPVELTGRPASRGSYLGRIVPLGAEATARRPAATPAEEQAALEGAILQAITELTGLADLAGDDGAAMIGFQIAMLEDEALRAPALAAIAAGEPADRAWRQALDHEISGYQASEDELFRARATDLRDLRDRVLRILVGGGATLRGSGGVLAGTDVPPSTFLEVDWSSGGALALAEGSPASHVAMLARARGVPMVVGLGPFAVNGHDTALVDGDQGRVVLSPTPAMVREWEEANRGEAERHARELAFLTSPARTRDGVPIEVLVNVAGPEDLARIPAGACDGIGLMRSEFLFRDGEALPGEERQYAVYRRFVEWAEGRPVTIRTLDIGGDKPIRGVTPEGESNPFLGLRGVRLTLARPELFRTQLRALARAAAHGPLKIMLPMVTVPSEFAAAARLLEECVGELREAGIPHARPSLGIMIEVPAAAIMPELFADAAFFSIGSNDLTQYVTAAARDSAAVAGLGDSQHPAVLSLIGRVARFGADRGLPVSLCGDMASDPAQLASLLAAGLRSLSVAPAALGAVKAALAELDAAV